MTNKQLLSKLKTVIKTKGTFIVTYELGYRSPNTLLNWFKNGEIPGMAYEKVFKYIQRGKI